MIMALRHMGGIARRLIGLKRYGALRALAALEMIPPAALTLLSVLLFWVPRRLRLPDNPGERLALALASFGPAYIKLGQTLATRPDMVGPLATGLATLQDKMPPFAPNLVKKTLLAEFGAPIEAQFADFDYVPVAAASIAQVHRAQIITAEGGRRDVAVKILRPGIAKRFLRDIALFDWAAHVAERWSTEARRLRMVDSVAELRATTLEELDLNHEADNAELLADLMGGEHGYHIPVIDRSRSTPHILTMEWIDAIPLRDRSGLVAAGHDVNQLATKVVQIFLTQAMRDGFFHADLHQGNLMVRADGTLVALDFGIMGNLGRKERFFLAEILFCFTRGDYKRAAEVHIEAGYVPPYHSVERLAAALKNIAEPIRDIPVEQVSGGDLLAKLFATTADFDMQARPELLQLQRSMVMAEGMALHLDPSTNMWDISRPVIEEWVKNNLSPEVRLADFMRKLPTTAQRLWQFLEDHETAATTAAGAMPVPLAKGRETVKRGWLLPFMSGMAFAYFILLLKLLVFMSAMD